MKDLLSRTARIVGAHVAHNHVAVGEVPEVIKLVSSTLTSLANPAPAPKRKPAVPITQSVQPDYLVCLEDGVHLKMLKRYLRSRFGLSPEEYRRKWGLPWDYPMISPSYSARRSETAKRLGLGKQVRRQR